VLASGYSLERMGRRPEACYTAGHDAPISEPALRAAPAIVTRPAERAGRRATQWLLASLGWLAGLAWQLQQAAAAPAGSAALGAVVAVVAVGLVVLLRRRQVVCMLLLVLAAVAAGWASTEWRAGERLAAQLDDSLQGQDLLLVGHVARLPQQGPTGTRFEFVVERAQRQLGGEVLAVPAQVPDRVRLAWYAGVDADGLLLEATEGLRAGQRWQLLVRLRQPHGPMNPHGFDTELWLWEQGVRATGYVRALPGAANRKLAEADAAPVERLRQRIRDALFAHLGPTAEAGVLAALAIGDQGAIERAEWDIFRASGVAHLMSISGLHVTMFAWALGGLAGWLWRASPRLMMAVPAQVAAPWIGLAGAAAYAVLAGFGVPAQRTLAMLAVVVVLRAAGRRWPAHGVLLAAAVAVSVLDPWALLQPGFWLSFGAVALLMLSPSDAAGLGLGGAAVQTRAQNAWQRLRAVAASGLRTQAVATVGLAPLTLVCFQQLSLVGFGANLVAIPLVTLLITPLALAGVLLPVLWTAAAALVQALMLGLGALAQLPWATWHAPAAPAWGSAAGLLGGLLLVAPLPGRLRLCGAPLLLPLLLPPIERPADGRFEVLAVDVGQGTAVLVRTRQHLLLYDSGPRYGPDSDAGGRLLLPLLRARGESAVDLLMLSHRDSDHVGGATTLLRHAGVRAISSSLEAGHPLRDGTVPHQPCAAGQRWDWDGVRFEVLHPLPGAVAAKPNHLSCVLRVQEAGGGGSSGRSLLLTGDIEAPQEAALLQRLADGSGPALASEALLVPHHGSRTSSTPAFLAAVAPRVAVVQAAYRSRFGHPAPEVVQRYTDRGIEVVRTDRCGAWHWRADGSEHCERAGRRRIWHHGWHHRAGPDPAEPPGCSASNDHLPNPARRAPCPSTLR
jgi:competence protein ComEC